MQYHTVDPEDNAKDYNKVISVKYGEDESKGIFIEVPSDLEKFL